MSKELFGTIEKKKNNRYSIIASTSAVDRDGERILPASFKNLPAYLSGNPVILWAHDYRVPPVAKAVAGDIGDSAMTLDIEFADTDFAREVKYLYDNGFMNSFSVGFIPKSWDRDSEGNIVYTDCELLEVSCVPVPANAQANIMRSAKSAGVALPNISKLFGADNGQISEPTGETREEKEPLTVAQKMKRGICNE